MWTYIWLAIFVAAAVLEFITFAMVSIWLAVGSLVGVILSFFNIDPTIQVIIVLIITVLCILFLRKFSLKFIDKNKGKTNIDLIIGSKIKLITEIKEDSLGTAKFNGVIWNVASEDGLPIAAEEYVIVKEISGNKLIVEKEKKYE